MATYDNKPSVLEANGDGSYTYRWNINETTITTGVEPEETATKWECEEVVIWNTVTRNKITESVVGALWPQSYEQKLLNDYYAAKEGLCDPKDVELFTSRYVQFLKDRKAIKEHIAKDCDELNII